MLKYRRETAYTYLHEYPIVSVLEIKATILRNEGWFNSR